MILRPPISTRTDTLLPYTTLFRSDRHRLALGVVDVAGDDRAAPRNLVADKLRSDIIGDAGAPAFAVALIFGQRSEEHTSELQSLMRISYAVFCLKKKIGQWRSISEYH